MAGNENSIRVSIRLPWSNTIEIPVRGIYRGHPHHEWTNLELLDSYVDLEPLYDWLDKHAKGHADVEWQKVENGSGREINLSPEFRVETL